MKIRAFLESKQITEKELSEHFVIDKERIIADQFDEEDICWNCGAPDYCVHPLPTEGWKYLQYCSQCNRLNLRYKCEPMGGNHTEPVKVFKEKDDDSVPPMYEKKELGTIYTQIPGF